MNTPTPPGSPAAAIKTLARYPEMADPQCRPRYTGIPTFFRAPYTEDLSQVDIGVIGVPLDAGVTNRPGTRHGPRAVRDQSSLLRRVNAATGIAPFDTHRVRDLGDCWIEQPFTLQGALAEVEAYFRTVTQAGVRTLAVGGDHSMSWPILRAQAAVHGPLGMVHIDAHSDTGDDYLGSNIHHGAPFRRAVEEGLLDPTRVIQIGIRGHTNALGGLWSFSRDSGMRVLEMDEFHDKGWRYAVEEARRVARGPIYLSYDIDSLDPSFAPGTGTPEAGGLSVIEALRLVRGLTGLDVRGADLVEVSPPFDTANITAFNGASILFELLSVLAAPPGSVPEDRK